MDLVNTTHKYKNPDAKGCLPSPLSVEDSNTRTKYLTELMLKHGSICIQVIGTQYELHVINPQEQDYIVFLAKRITNLINGLELTEVEEYCSSVYQVNKWFEKLTQCALYYHLRDNESLL